MRVDLPALYALVVLVALSAASASAQELACSAAEGRSIAEIGARLTACGGPEARDAVTAWVRVASAAQYGTPGSRSSFLRSSSLFRDPACASAWQGGEREAIFNACRAAYGGGHACASGSDEAAFVSIVESALDHDYHVPEGPMRRWVAASLILGAFAPAPTSGERLVFVYEGERPVARWHDRTYGVDSPSSRASLLRALARAPRPLPLEIQGYAFEHVTMLAALIEHRIAFHLVGAEPVGAEPVGAEPAVAGHGAPPAASVPGLALGELEDESGAGDFDSAILVDALRRTLPAIAACIGTPLPEGRVVATLTVDGRRARLDRLVDETSSSAAERCVRRHLRALPRLSAAAEGGTVTYVFPFVFGG